MLACAHNVLSLNPVSTQIRSCFHEENIQQTVSDAWFFWHMWSTDSLNVSHSLHLNTPHAHFYIVIYSRFFRTSQPHPRLPHRLHPVWSLFFSTGSRRRRRRRRKGAGTKLRRAHVSFSALVRCCQSLQLCGAEEAKEPRPRRWAARLQLSEQSCDVVTESAEGERAEELSAPSHRLLQTSSCEERREKGWLCCDTFWFLFCFDGFLTVLTGRGEK